MRRRWLGGRRFAALLVLAGTFLVLLPRTAMADPSASVGDSTLSWDQTTSLHGSGFLPGAQVQVVLYPNSVILATTTVNGDGSVSTSIRAPHVNSGKSYVLGVQGQMANGVYGGAQVPITIVGPTPTVSVSSTHLHWGDQPVVSGALWHPGTSVRISLLGSGDIGSGAVGSNGDFAATVTIPSQLKSATSYQIVATGEGIDGLFHLVNAQVTIEGNRPSMALSTTTAPRGSKLTVSGRLWLKGTSVLVTLVPGFEKLGSFPVADDGTFSATVTIPAKAGGNDPHAIVVTGTGTDGLFAYLLTRLDLGGTAPKGTTTANAIGIDQNTPPPPGVDLHVGGTPGTVALNDKGTGNGISAKLLLVAVIILLTLATAAVIALTARRDVRRNLHVQRVRLQRRFSRRA